MDVLQQIGGPHVCPHLALVKGSGVLLGYKMQANDSGGAWITPGGRCGAGETLEQTLSRELEEETGITEFEITKYLGEVEGAKTGDVVPVFVASTDQEPKLMEPDIFSEWKWVKFGDYIKGSPYNIMNPRVYDLITAYIKNHDVI